MSVATQDSNFGKSDTFGGKAGLADLAPPDAQLLETTTIESLRSVQHKDINGNPISTYTTVTLPYSRLTIETADPDLSNPTRPRLERPLDTIRSFEKAIDSGYKRRSSMMRGGKCTTESNAVYIG